MGKKLKIGARECKNLHGVAGKTVPGSSSSFAGGGASCGCSPRSPCCWAGGWCGAGGALLAAVAACGSAAAGLVAGAAAAGAVMAMADAAAAALGVSPGGSCPWRLGIAAAWYLNKSLKQYQ